MKTFVLVAAAAATFGMVAMIVPAAAQGVTIGVGGDGYGRDRGVVVQSRTHVRPRTDRVVIIKKRRPPGHAYGWDRGRNPHRTVIIER